MSAEFYEGVAVDGPLTGRLIKSPSRYYEYAYPDLDCHGNLKLRTYCYTEVVLHPTYMRDPQVFGFWSTDDRDEEVSILTKVSAALQELRGMTGLDDG